MDIDIKTYVDLVEKHFSFLKNCGFRIVYQNEYRPGYGWFRIGMESASARILFVRERGAGVLFIGPLFAPFHDEENPLWINIVQLLSFILKEKINWSLAENMKEGERVEAVFSFYAEKLRPVCNQVLSMFATQEAITSWYPLFEQWRKTSIAHSSS